jgi:broad specificity polyphosphatase/5'/3'-nucleotidase SurE
MNTTYIIAEAARKIALSPEPYGSFDIWEDVYKVLCTYDCAFDHIAIQKVEQGAYLANNLVVAMLPEEFDEDLFLSVMIPIMRKRHEEIERDRKESEEAAKEEEERERQERESANWEETKRSLNDTFGLY